MTVKDAIHNLPFLKPNDGNEQVRIKDKKESSEYEKWIKGKISVNALFKNLRKKNDDSSENKQISLF